MNNVTLDTVGIDSVIEGVKDDLYDALVSVWSGTIDGYARVYKNINSKNHFKPEIYLGNSDYKEVFLNDEVSATFFFLDGDKDSTEDELVYTSGVKVIFMVNLDTIYQGRDGREDERARLDAVAILREHAYERFTITGIEKGVKNVFSGLDISQMKYSDIQPYHCFSIEIDLQYYLTKKCT